MAPATLFFGPVQDVSPFRAWPATMPGEGGRHLLVGPPLAPELSGEPPDGEASIAARVALGFDGERGMLLVLGGSQGARGLNRFCVEQGVRLVASGLQVLHQVGPGRRDEAGAAMAGYRCEEYLDDVPTALRAATLVLCRGGASTLAEVAALARPAVVIPYPHHADRHQEKNARCLGDGVIVIEEAALDRDTCDELIELAGSGGEERRRAMSRTLRDAVPRDAASRMSDELVRLAGMRSQKPAEISESS